MSRDDGQASRSNVVPSGCVLGTSLLVIAIAVAGYFGYRYVSGALDVPEELESYATPDSVRSLIEADAPRPPETARLDSAWLAFYIDGLGAIETPLLGTRDLIDSMYRAARDHGDSNITTLVTSPALYRAIATVAPATKRALVGYLNARGRSFDEYVWAKERTLAATDLTRESADSARGALVGRYFTSKSTNVSIGGDAIGIWFARIDSLRASGTITDDERRLAAPQRRRILERGLASLYGFDTDFER